MIEFFTMKQYQTKSNDEYLTRFNAKANNLELVGGAHFFCSPKFLKKKAGEITPDEFCEQSERTKAVFLAKGR